MTDALQLFILEILKALIPIVVPALTAMLIALAYQAARWVRSKFKTEQLAQIDVLVGIAVKAAEQSGLIGTIVNEASAKKAWALAEAQRLLDERGLKGISVTTLSTMIEAAIRDGVQMGSAPAINKVPPISSPEGAPSVINAAVDAPLSAYPPPYTPFDPAHGSQPPR